MSGPMGADVGSDVFDVGSDVGFYKADVGSDVLDVGSDVGFCKADVGSDVCRVPECRFVKADIGSDSVASRCEPM